MRSAAFKLITVAWLIQTSFSILDLQPERSLYFPEKYFRFLSNNYEMVNQGDFWTTFSLEKGIGFKAKEDFGSFILLKDWSMYSFKLQKVIFKPMCPYMINGTEFDAEMQLVHTLDNGYFTPGRRIHLGINYLVISVPFKMTSNDNPANDKIFHFVNLYDFLESSKTVRTTPLKNISPRKTIKLHQMIQHQPSYLFENNIPGSGEKSLILVFSQFHYISEAEIQDLKSTFTNLGIAYTDQDKEDLAFQDNDNSTIYYRNWDNPDEVTPKATLMAYNGQKHISFSYLMFLLTIAALLA